MNGGQQDTGPAAGSGPGSADCVLVIDDEAPVRDIVRMTLRDAGYKVETASGGGEGLEILRRTNVGLVLLDMVMPGMDGIEVLDAVRVSHRDTPVVLMTAVTDGDAIRRAVERSPITLLSKPFSLDQLMTCAVHFLRRPAGDNA